MSTRQIHVFISHAWAYSEDYITLSTWIFDQRWRVGQASLDIHNYSVPRDDPFHDMGTERELREAIYNQIGRSHVVVIPVGMYASHSKWIQKEINGANYYEKPILAVIPRGKKRLSGVVVDNATREVGWTRESVIKGVWELYKKSQGQ
ncbi:TIR domain-containing protein [Aquabacterium humicola]|uniref:TIR domain-containing protein n=1 Tax=Aquabacterium humicola TaxID=3237377 RepID=UPI0025432E53|nr:TIR domain-containing protein [Rubrivivax pictus]